MTDEGRLHSAPVDDILVSIVPPPGDDVGPLDVIRGALDVVNNVEIQSTRRLYISVHAREHCEHGTDVIRDALARVTWIREEYDPAVREQALEDLETDLAGYLQSSSRLDNLPFADRRAA